MKYLYYKPHYYYFSPHSLTEMLKKTGFEIISMDLDETDLRFAEVKIKRHYSKYKSSKFVSVGLFPIYALARVFKMQNKMVVYAKKV